MTVIAEVATVVSVVIALGAWFFPRDKDDKPTPPTTTSASPQVGAPVTTGPPTSDSSPSAPPESVAGGKSLLDLSPERGADRIEKSGSALLIQCGAGTTQDRAREVAYPLYGAYRGFTATLVAGGSAPRETSVQLEVFADQTTVANKIVKIGETQTVKASVDGAAFLTLRLTCQRSSGNMRLESPTVR